MFFFDEAHLLFKDTSKPFLDSIAQTVRLIRSKGVGVFFVTQTPGDVPDDVLAQLGSRIQHQLRAHTPNDAKALRQTVATFPRSGYDLAETLTILPTGEAIVTVMDPDGAPTPVAWTKVRAPQSLMAPTDAALMAAAVAASPLQARYGQAIDRESAYELLTERVVAASAAATSAPPSEPDQRSDPPATSGDEHVAGPARVPSASRGRSSLPRPGTSPIEELMGSSVVKQFARSAGREIVRGLFGAAKRRR